MDPRFFPRQIHSNSQPATCELWRKQRTHSWRSRPWQECSSQSLSRLSEMHKSLSGPSFPRGPQTSLQMSQAEDAPPAHLPPDVGSRARAPGRLGKGGGMGLVLTVVLYLSWSEPRGSAPSGAPPRPRPAPPPLPRPGAQGGSVREGPPASLPGLL